MKAKATRVNLNLRRLFASQAYKDWFRYVSEKYERFGVPFPTEPFEETVDMYQKDSWYSEMLSKVNETQHSQEYKDAVAEIADEDGLVRGWDALAKIAEIREKYTVEPLGEYIDKLVRDELRLNPFKDRKEFKICSNHIRKKILHGAREYATPPSLSHRFHDHFGDPEETLWLKIEPEMDKEDFIDCWDYVAEWQKRLPDHKERYNNFPMLERDVFIGDIYNELSKKEAKRGGYSGEGSIVTQIAVRLEKAGFKEMTEDNIYKVINKHKKSKP